MLLGRGYGKIEGILGSAILTLFKFSVTLNRSARKLWPGITRRHPSFAGKSRFLCSSKWREADCLSFMWGVPIVHCCGW